VRFLGFFFVILIILSATVPNSNALTMSDKAKQLQEREAALKTISKAKVSNYVSKMIVIELSPACIATLKSNMPNKCLSYEDLASFDNTNQVYSGKFVTDNGFFHRAKPPIPNHEVVYRWTNETIICVDCYGKPLIQSKSILIEPNTRNYALESDKKITNNTRYDYHDRYVQDCFKARITSSLALVQDTITLLESDCKTTGFHEKETIIKPYSKLSYDGTWYSYLKWLEAAKKATKETNCIKSTSC
jgi:hypothetical protein